MVLYSGGSYRGSVIFDSPHFAACLKYVLRNPVSAGLSETVQGYKYTGAAELDARGLILSSPMEAKCLFLNSQHPIERFNLADSS